MSNYKFDDADIKRLKDDTDFESLFSNLGIEYQKSNNRYLDFLCPFHQDTHFGSAKVDLISKKCKCFVCDKSFSPLDLIMETEGKNFHEALITLANIEGCLWEFEQKLENKSQSQYPLRRLTSKEKKLLGFRETEIKDVVSVSKSNIPDSIYDVKGRYYLQQKNTSLSWNFLYVHYPTEYRGIVLSQCYSRMKELSAKITSTEAFINSYDGDCKWYFEENLKMLKRDYQNIEAIAKNFGIERVISAIKKQT